MSNYSDEDTDHEKAQELFFDSLSAPSEDIPDIIKAFSKLRGDGASHKIGHFCLLYKEHASLALELLAKRQDDGATMIIGEIGKLVGYLREDALEILRKRAKNSDGGLSRTWVQRLENAPPPEKPFNIHDHTKIWVDPRASFRDLDASTEIYNLPLTCCILKDKASGAFKFDALISNGHGDYSVGFNITQKDVDILTTDYFRAIALYTIIHENTQNSRNVNFGSIAQEVLYSPLEKLLEYISPYERAITEGIKNYMKFDYIAPPKDK